MEILGVLWDEVIMRPMINSLALLYTVLFNNFGLSIIVFTGIIRVALIPLTIRQTRQMKKMSEMQPKIKAVQEKYKNKTGREERAEMSRETMRLYREAGVNPVGCLGPVFIQIPIWIGLYRAILRAVPPTPEGLANLNETLYSWNPAAGRIPLDATFLGIDLVDFVQAAPMYFAIAMPILVGVSMFVQQKMSTPPSTDPRQAQTNQIMLWTMPIMFGFFTLQFPSGLGLYILFSNVLGIAIQYFVSPKQSQEALVSLTSSITRLVGRSRPAAQPAEASVTAAASAPPGEKEPNGEPDVHGENRRRSNRNRTQVSRRKARGRRHKGR